MILCLPLVSTLCRLSCYVLCASLSTQAALFGIRQKDISNRPSITLFAAVSYTFTQTSAADVLKAGTPEWQSIQATQ